MPLGAHSTARDWVRLVTPALAAAECAVPGPAGADADLYREIAALEAAMERNGCEGAR